MPDLDEMKNKANEAAQNMQQDQQADQAQGAEQENKSGSKMDQAKKKLDADQDGDFDMDDVKKMGGDAVNKVKGLFKKD